MRACVPTRAHIGRCRHTSTINCRFHSWWAQAFSFLLVWSSVFWSIFLGCSNCWLLGCVFIRYESDFHVELPTFTYEDKDDVRNDKIRDRATRRRPPVDGTARAYALTRLHSPWSPLPTHSSLLLSVVERGRRRGAGQRHRKHQLQRSPIQLHVECIINFLAELFTKS